MPRVVILEPCPAVGDLWVDTMQNKGKQQFTTLVQININVKHTEPKHKEPNCAKYDQMQNFTMYLTHKYEYEERRQWK